MKAVSRPHAAAAAAAAAAAPLGHFCQHLFRQTAHSKAPIRLSLASQHACIHQSAKPLTRNTLPNTTKSLTRSQSQSQSQPTSQLQYQPQFQSRKYAIPSAPPTTSPSDPPVSPEESLTKLHATTERLAAAILDHPNIPDDVYVEKVLAYYHKVVQTVLAHDTTTQTPSTKQTPSTNGTATSALLSSVAKNPSKPTVTKDQLLNTLSDRAFDILRHEPVFITAPMLNSYVGLQSLLQKPETFPTVFHLYRTKPVPTATRSGPITYTTPNPDKASLAIPPTTAETAIDAVIALRDLPLALSTVDATYRTPAHKKSKFLRRALLPITGLALTPPAAYTIATQFSDWQVSMEPQMATQVAMAGILTYTTAVATVGYVALTTANDQMVRVTWATGLPLWERWMREEERNAMDKIAQAWGFKNRDKWGEEEGDEWDLLKEWTGVRGMIVDRVELMDGME